ncbi:acetate--CoA ligase family protein [Altericroceibacterium endophyticum]|uniref:acetate--CoA ligase family protein n=1 Tax=Altericroceibacterium endophyticum TaxID=1808508 RepID=UPI00136EF700
MTDAAAGAVARPMMDRVLRPRSVAIIGVSSKEGSAGRNAVANLLRSGFDGEIHLVSRSGVKLEGLASVPGVADLPRGIDLAILAVPGPVIEETLKACASHGMGAATVFASGFAEQGEDGRAAQERLRAIAEQAGMGLVGPNCLGYRNYIQPLAVSFGKGGIESDHPGDRSAVAVLSQSGGMMAHCCLALTARGLPLSYSVATGNEATLGIEDFLGDFAQDAHTQSVMVYAEQVRRPLDFLEAVRACNQRGKSVVLMHPGRSARAQEAAQSHSGAMAGDYAAMRELVSRAGAVMVETLEEFVDVAEILARSGKAPHNGLGIMTTSGAFCGSSLDYCDTLGLDVPPLSPSTKAVLDEALPAFAHAGNPLDLTTQPMQEPELLGKGLQALLDDPAIGSVVVAITPGGGMQSLRYFDGLQPALSNAQKPVSLSLMGDGSELPQPFFDKLREGNVHFTRSPERSLRTMAAVTRYGCSLERAERSAATRLALNVDGMPCGNLPEHRAKALLQDMGVSVPQAALARTVDEAVSLAASIGYPVALKAQAKELMHKTEAGGVELMLADEDNLRAAWARMSASVAGALNGAELDGILVEEMALAGVDMIVAGRRDPEWGAVVMVGMGGIWAEAMRDFRLFPADLAETDIEAELRQLRSAPVLTGGRGRPACDLAALVDVAARVGAALRAEPRLREVEINPLRVFEEGRGSMALDALARFQP